MEKMTKTVFKADDGAIFETANECEAHEKAIIEERTKYTYWLVIHGPDCTEGRGWYRRTYIKALTKNQSLIEDYCYTSIGPKTAFVQGVSPINNWSISQLTWEQFENKKKGRVGDFTYEWAEVELRQAGRGKPLIEVTEEVK